tara:strand:- start:140 stop:931 length:792 start_codon:yes stop_codon:yes gene_type:complete
MKKYLVIGNPIDHSLSPQIHNYWIKKNNISGIYDKQKLNSSNLNELIIKIKNKEINGLNVTVPFKNEIISYLDTLSNEAKTTQSVNTIYLENNKVVGHNTDIDGFELAIKNKDYDVKGKRIFILGAGGVVPSIIFALNKMKASEIVISNRTKQKAENLKDLFKNLSIVDWGKIPYFDMIINATSLGLSNKDDFNLDFTKIEKGKFFYDVIYNPKETNFLRKAKLMGNQTENGKKMFIYQAASAFKIWHNIYPKIDEEVNKLLD